jgi:DNA polymerase I-like protein with 3'-5' exonuclease and polymerase domains/uracil-DNA glycosylase
MKQQVRPDGQPTSPIMIVQDAPGYAEVRTGVPLTGSAGEEFNKMLHEAGLQRASCFVTSLSREHPLGNDASTLIAKTKKEVGPHHLSFRDKYVLPQFIEGLSLLEREIEMVKPKVIITLGSVSTFALTGAWGVDTWRGSELPHPSGAVVIPILPPERVMIQWSNRIICVQDLRRAKRVLEKGSHKPDWRFLVRPSFQDTVAILNDLLAKLSAGPLMLSFDLETRAGHIACAGLSWNKLEAICIPFMCIERQDGYWPLAEESHITHLLYRVLTHANAQVVGQNLLYDCQYTYRHWHFTPRVYQDTMISMHTLYAGQKKALDFQASLFCEYYVYWKDDGKTWAKDIGEEQLWRYNCEDCVRTYEVAEVERAAIQSLGLEAVENFQQRLFWPVLKAMQQGVHIDLARRSDMAKELTKELEARENFFQDVLGHALNPRSSKQMTTLFYDDLRLPPVKTRAKKGVPGHVTCNDDALDTLQRKEPLIRPLVKAIREYRSLGVFLSTFVQAPLDVDQRMRCSYNICGTETYRFSSSENAFGSGTNLQNIPKGIEAKDPTELSLPNIRKIFVPDPGFMFFDSDLDRADLQVVAWEADDTMLKEALKLGVDLHILNAYAITGKEPPDLAWLVESHPEYPAIRAKMKVARQLAKSWCHGCVTAGHEVLTPTGWVDVSEYRDGTPIAVWGEGIITFEVPKSFNRDIAVDLVTFEGQSWSQEMTWDHRVVYKDKNGYKVKRASEVTRSARLPKGGLYSGPVNEPRANLIAAFQAEGTIDDRGRIFFHLKKQGKIDRLFTLWPEYRIYSRHKGALKIELLNTGLTKEHKYPGAWMLNWNGESLDAWLNEQEHWDDISSASKSNRDWLMTFAHLRGSSSYAHVSSMYVNRRTVDPTPVYCPQTSTGFWVFRRGTHIGVTGNTNYGGSARTMAIAAGITVKESEAAQRRYFGQYPGILDWHCRTEEQLRSRRYVENKFGYRRYYFDRVDTLLPEALAWIPQSTVAIYINKVWVRIHENLPEVQVLLQVHDSLCGQFPAHLRDWCVKRIKEEASQVIVPYHDPLVIPVGVKVSAVSWGDCE